MGKKTFVYRVFNETGASDPFTSDIAYGDVPTDAVGPAGWFGNLASNVTGGPFHVSMGVITRVHWRLKPANAVTYRLSVWENDYTAGGAGSYELEMGKLFDSNEVVANCVKDVEYDAHELVRPFMLKRPGAFFFACDWSAAPGEIQGYLTVSGERDEINESGG